jgi:hypothetical protein
MLFVNSPIQTTMLFANSIGIARPSLINHLDPNDNKQHIESYSNSLNIIIVVPIVIFGRAHLHSVSGCSLEHEERQHHHGEEALWSNHTPYYVSDECHRAKNGASASFCPGAAFRNDGIFFANNIIILAPMMPLPAYYVGDGCHQAKHGATASFCPGAAFRNDSIFFAHNSIILAQTMPSSPYHVNKSSSPRALELATYVKGYTII